LAVRTKRQIEKKQSLRLSYARNEAFIQVRKPLSERIKHMTQHILTVLVIDTNNRSRGNMPVSIEFDAEGPTRIQHNGQTYCRTGKVGRNQETGLTVGEMATIDDARLWVTIGGKRIWED
jgi:hypothetical protein